MFVIALAASSCSSQSEMSPDEVAAHKAEVEAWQERRDTGLRKNDGWLSLVGLHWLSEGDNAFGSDPSVPVPFPEGKSPANAGRFVLEGGSVRIIANADAGVTHNGEPVRALELSPDTSEEVTELEMGSLLFYVIERGGEFAVRIKDRENELLTNFAGMDEYPIDPAWRIQGRFEPYDPPLLIEVPNITGQVNQIDSPGAVVFERDGKTHRLDVLAAGDAYWVIFADETNGGDTYGGGRFLYTDLENENGDIVIDFNLAYNPPCVFTVYATCPLPPEGNEVALAITAGEKMFYPEGQAH